MASRRGRFTALESRANLVAVHRHLSTIGVLLWLLASCERGAEATTAKMPSAPVQTEPTPSVEPAEAAPEAPEDPKAGDIHYVEVLLGGARADDTLPMIVAVHGLGDEPRSFAHLLDAFPERARLILPRGLDPTPEGGWSWFPIRARDPDVEALSVGIRNAADKLAVAIEALRTSKPTSGKPIVTGFSQGGMLTFTLAVHHPEVVGAAVPVGGWLPPPLWPSEMRQDVEYPEIHALHGTADNAVRFEPTDASVRHLKSLGLPVELHPYDGVRHVITPEMRRDLQDRLLDAVRKATRAPDKEAP